VKRYDPAGRERARGFTASLLHIFTLSALLTTTAVHAQEKISHGRFKDVVLYRPSGEPKEFVMFLSGDGGWNAGVVDMATALVERGALVAGINVPQLFRNLEADGAKCVFPDGDLENLSHYLQGYTRMAGYHTPILAGYSSGATLAYAMIAQAPSGTFAGAISLGFCPELELGKALCKGEGVHFVARPKGKGVDLLPTDGLDVPWFALHGELDKVCQAQATRTFIDEMKGAQFISLPKVGHGYSVEKNWMPQYLAAYDELTAHRARATPSLPSTVADLPIIEVPGTTGVASPATSDLFAIILSGDGGWAGLDKNVANALAQKGIPVAGFDALRYFWTARSPASTAVDVDRLVRFYAAHWGKKRALLIGYSQGADVLPFVINRLPETTQAMVAETVLMGLSENATFEFHLASWIGRDTGTLPIRPEAVKLKAANTLCIYGDDEDDSLCPELPQENVTSQSLPGGHHFDGAYGKLADTILARIAKSGEPQKTQ
jgi:type IV secretory pathway VirJ component